MTMMIQWRHPMAVVTARVSFRSSGSADSVYLGGSDLGLFSVRHSSVTVHSVQVRFDKKTGR
ncbi:hypothetical protein HanIR_Chr17g0877471 [Helianthus annuus]|nr:hypothetical protein HanIR_Chr17g0877471 [Helianthus annuus]